MQEVANNSFCFYLEGTGARLLLLGSGILVVCGHGEPISVEETAEKKKTLLLNIDQLEMREMRNFIYTLSIYKLFIIIIIFISIIFEAQFSNKQTKICLLDAVETQKLHPQGVATTITRSTSYQYLSAPVCPRCLRRLHLYGPAGGGNAANSRRSVRARAAERPAIGPARWSQGYPWQHPPPPSPPSHHPRCHPTPPNATSTHHPPPKVFH